MIPPATEKPSLDLAMIGNCSFAALVDKMARIVWCCLPRFDGDPVFHSLLGTRGTAQELQRVRVLLLRHQA